ncbi:MAG: SAM-dependent methyltransferase [Polyangiales bacterium]|jgi:SAM-dependent methyltransferase
MSTDEHWDSVYKNKSPDGVSWYRPRLEHSLALIDGCSLPRDACIVDIGGGASTLVDDLLEQGFSRVAVADLSPRALEHSRARLGERASAVNWVVGDATTPLFDDSSVDFWHDRAVFHFLTSASARDAYVANAARSIRPAGYALVATFSPTGPERCSGLPVVRYTSAQIADALGEHFTLIEEVSEEHVTPSGASQSFSYALCRRK